MSCLRTLSRATNLVAASRHLSSAYRCSGTRQLFSLPVLVANDLSICTGRRFLCKTGGPNVKSESEAVEKKSIGVPVDLDPSERIENVPNESWSKETLDVYNKLQNLVDNSSGAWVKHYTSKKANTRERFFTLCVEEDGKLFEYCLFYNKSEGVLKAVCQFGPYTKGLNRFVNGGAIAVILDIATSLIPQVTGHPSLTANLSVNFQNPIPIESTVSVECRITSVESKKVFVEGEMKSPDGAQTYATVKTLCIRVA